MGDIGVSRSAQISSNADGRNVNQQLLNDVEAFLDRSHQDSGRNTCGCDELFRIEQFLYTEARLLDARRYQDWLKLLADDFIYWVPSKHGNASLRDDVSVNFDDRRRIEDRVVFASTAGAFAQTPPSRTLRSLSNVQAWHSTGSYDVSAGIVIWSHRRGRTVQFAGHLQMLLQPTSASYQIKAKIIELLDCDEPQGNNTFIL